MPTPSTCVIYNANAGRGGTAKTWQRVQQLLGNDVVYRPSERPWHAAELAEQAAREGFATVVAAGGDGTVHEVINGILQSERPEVIFSLFPLGSGNDYARMIHMPFDPEGMIHRLRSDDVWEVDVGLVSFQGTQRYFCNTLGLGLSAHVTCEAKKIRWLRGIPLYGLAALKSIYRHFRSCPIRLTVDEHEDATHLLYLAVALGKAEGGGFVVAPEARLDDGLFDILHVTNLTRWQALGYLPKMISGKLPPQDDQIRRRQVRSIHIIADQPLPMHTDGEVLAPSEQGVTECAIRLLPGRLKIRGKAAS